MSSTQNRWSTFPVHAYCHYNTSFPNSLLHFHYPIICNFPSPFFFPFVIDFVQDDEIADQLERYCAGEKLINWKPKKSCL